MGGFSKKNVTPQAKKKKYRKRIGKVYEKYRKSKITTSNEKSNRKSTRKRKTIKKQYIYMEFVILKIHGGFF